MRGRGGIEVLPIGEGPWVWAMWGVAAGLALMFGLIRG